MALGRHQRTFVEIETLGSMVTDDTIKTLSDTPGRPDLKVKRLREDGSKESYSEADLLETRTYCWASSLEVSCRKLLIESLLTPECVHWNSLPKRLMDLLGKDTSPSASYSSTTRL